jgi:hypothetical protein
VPSDPEDSDFEGIKGMSSDHLVMTFPQFCVAAFPDGTPDVFGDNNADADIPDFLHEAVTGPHLHDNDVLFSAGEEPVSAMAKSLSRVL